MAELPDINEQIGKDQIANETDNRQRLQKSLRAGLLNVVKSVDGMHNTLRDLYEMQKAGWDAQAMQAGLDLEAAREASRGGGLGGGGDGDVTVNGDVTLDAGKNKGLFGGLIGGIGKLFAGAGAAGGMLLAGAGILAGGAGYLLSQINDLDAENIVKQVKTLFTLKDEVADGSLLKLLGESGVLFLALTGIGAGLAIFSIGGAFASAADYFSTGSWAKNVVKNVGILLSLRESLNRGVLELLGESGVLFLALTGIGAGLAIFSVGGAIASASDMFQNETWAQNIVDNVGVLLSLRDSLDKGILELLGESGVLFLALTGIGAGLAIFAVGGAIASGSDMMQNDTWAHNIVKNVGVLLNLRKSLDKGMLELLGESGVLFLALSGIGAGLAVFAVGGAIASGSDMMQNDTWAQNIVNNVGILLGLRESLNKGMLERIGESGVLFFALSGIGAGLAVFGAGTAVAAVAQKFAGEGFATKIVTEVRTLLGVLDGENVTQEKADIFSSVMGTIASGLMKFSGGKFVSKLLDAGTAVFSFLTGSESPIQEMLNVADRAADIFAGANAIDKVGDALNKISGLKFDGSNINMTDFANDLMRAIPAIETAIMGGTVGEGFFSSGTTIKGLASPDINFEQATKRIKELQMAINPNAMTATTGAEIDVRSSEVATAAAAPSVTDNTTTTAITNNTQNSVQSTTVASMSPYQRKVARIDRKRARLAKLQYG